MVGRNLREVCGGGENEKDRASDERKRERKIVREEARATGSRERKRMGIFGFGKRMNGRCCIKSRET